MTYDPAPFLRLRAACAALSAVEEARIHVANVLGLREDGTPIPSRIAHVYEPAAMFIVNADKARVKVNLSALEGLQLAEDAARKAAIKCMKEVAPKGLLDWAKAEPGVGDITLARVLGEIGHPRVFQPVAWIDNPDFDDSKPQGAENPKRLIVPNGEVRERTIAMLWQYCRVGDPQTHPRHFRRLEIEPTQTALMAAGKPSARARLFVVADTIVRQSFRFRDDERVAQLVANPPQRTGQQQNPKDPYAHIPLAGVYLVRRAITEGRTHTHPCARCRTTEEGAPLGAGHRDSDARRFVAKHFLKRLWQHTLDEPAVALGAA